MIASDQISHSKVVPVDKSSLEQIFRVSDSEFFLVKKVQKNVSTENQNPDG